MESVSNGIIIMVDKSKDFHLEFGERIADAKIHHINDVESPDTVTIYIN